MRLSLAEELRHILSGNRRKLEIAKPPALTGDCSGMDTTIDQENDGRHDFDCYLGTWNVFNRRLARRLVGSRKWEEFNATSDVRAVLGGIGNVEEYRSVFPDGQPLVGMTVRVFDPSTRLWSLYWADSRHGQLAPPVVGRFQNGIGEFLGDDLQDDVPVKVLFRWSEMSPIFARWEQAKSADGGETWEWNWEMIFTRDSSSAR